MTGAWTLFVRNSSEALVERQREDVRPGTNPLHGYPRLGDERPLTAEPTSRYRGRILEEEVAFLA